MFEKECEFCRKLFTLSKGAWKRQKSCKSEECEKARKDINNRLYKEKNPDCFKGRYVNLKEWREANPDYQREWYQKNKFKKRVNRAKNLKIQVNEFTNLIDSIDENLKRLRKMQVTVLMQNTDIQGAIEFGGYQT